MKSLIEKFGKPGGWVIAYALFGTLMTTGWDWGSEKGDIPAEVRNSQHGYRTYSYWHSGHHWHGPTFLFWSSSPYRGYRWGK